MRWTRQLLIMMLIALIGGPVLAGCSKTPAPPAVATTTPAPGSPAPSVVQAVEVADREVDLTIRSAAVGRQVTVRLLLPADFAEQPTRQWPVLYLLHGCCDTYDSWTRSTDIERLSRRSPMIIAMPEGGSVGFYSDWMTGPKWETFHTVELPGLLASAYRASGRQAIAGLSMGGFGALAYAARHPDQYAAVASFSGITHTLISPAHSQNYVGLIESEGEDPLALWGDPERDVDRWREHNPYDLAERLRGRPVFISCGNGEPGPLDGTGASWDEIEWSLNEENKALADRLEGYGVDAEMRLYGDGTHDWPYWERELGHAWPMLIEAIGISWNRQPTDHPSR